MLRRPLTAIVLFSARLPWLVLAIALVLAVGSAWLAVTRLQVSTDVDGLFSANLPWKRNEAEMKRLFPQFNDLLVAVIDARSPEAADATAAGLATLLRADTAHFKTVRRPDTSPYFDREGLLFLDEPTLGSLLDQTIDAQPFLGQLAADPSARGLFAALGLVAVGVERGQADLAGFLPALRGFDAALRSALDGKPQPLSWQTLLAGPAADLEGPYRIVLTQPKLNYMALAPGGEATQALRDAAAQLEFVKDGTARVRVTGQVALSDEEFATAARGAIVGLIGSMLVVTIWLFLAVRTWRLGVPVLITLMVGLLVTTGFATITVNPLNLISVAFAILFIGLAVDFAIQFSVRWREMSGRFPTNPTSALAATAERSGSQIVVAALATSAGFLAFTPTSFSGVAELGVIAGVGMLVALASTLTVLPAAIVLFHPAAGGRDVGFAVGKPLDRAVERWRWVILGVFGLLAVAGAAGSMRLEFDSDPLHTKDPHTEAMATLTDLSEEPITNPYTIDILVPDAAAAKAVVARTEPLSMVQQVVSIDSFVPEDQPPKLALLADAASLLAPTLAPRAPAAPVTPADLRLAAQTASGQLAKAVAKLPPDHPLAAIAADLAKLAAAPDSVLLAANGALTRFLPEQLQRLRVGLGARAVTEADVPQDIKRDWVLPDGRRRVQVSGKLAKKGNEELRHFVKQVRAVEPDAGGSAVAVVETARTIIRAFTHAAIGAIVAIMIILAVALRRVVDVLLVLAPLTLSALLTVLVVISVPLALNFANVIALPLLLGVGVSFNIYFVMNWRAGQVGPLASATARAVAFSALTTATAFGSLALSYHPGTSSMGVLLLISLGCTLLATLVFVPALLATLRPQPRATTVRARG